MNNDDDSELIAMPQVSRPQLDLSPEGNREPLAELIERELAALLLAGALPDGLVLTESAVARELEVGRTPSRIALNRLETRGLLHRFEGRGMLVGRRDAPTLRLDLGHAGLVLSDSGRRALRFSSHADRLYPELEKAVSSCMAFGRFQINQSKLASKFDVSRTVVLEMLARLETAGLVQRQGTTGWFVERLTPQLARDHYLMRITLEPVALMQAWPLLELSEVEECWNRVSKLLRNPSDVSFQEFDRVERDLHISLLHRCPVAPLVRAIRDSQLPLIATHYTIERYANPVHIRAALLQHLEVLTALLGEAPERAGDALRNHLEEAAKVTVPRLLELPGLKPGNYPCYFHPIPDEKA